MSDVKQLKHVGFIMDGNRRWAKAKGKSATYGHRHGYRSMKTILEAAEDLGIKYVSLYAFSTENWKRSKEEVDAILGLIRTFMSKELKELIARDTKVVWLGTEDNVPDDIVQVIRDAEAKTVDATGTTMAICFNYGGKREIVDSVNKVIEAGQEVTEESITENLYGPQVPPVDLIIRTSGEHRLSNFMLWRADYAELKFTDTYWPDFDKAELSRIVDEYHGRERRFGA